MDFKEMATVPGIVNAFQWSDAGELVATAGRNAVPLSDRLARCAAAASQIDDATLGPLSELHIYGAVEHAVLFMAPFGNPATYRTIGAAMTTALDPQSFIDFVRDAAAP